MNESRNSIFDKFNAVHRSVCGLVLSSFFVQVAFADVSLPPPTPTVHQTMNNDFPSSQALKNQGYDPSTGILRVQEINNGSSTVKKTGDTITGRQSKTVTVTGNYGEKATATTSITQNVSSSKLQTAFSAVLASAIALGGVFESDYASNAYNDFRSGDYGSAVRNMVGAVIQGLSKLDFTGLGSGINSFLQNINDKDDLKKAAQDASAKQAQAEKNGDLAGALENAALKKALDAASKINVDLDDFTKTKLANATKDASGNYKNLYLLKLTIYDDNWVSWVRPKQPSYSIYTLSSYNGSVGSKGISQLTYYSGHQVLDDAYDGFAGSTVKQILTDADLTDAISKISTPSDVQIKQTVQAMPLTETDVNSILQKMLDNQETNHKQLMDQLGKLGNIIPDATTSKEWQPVVMTTDPYTPLGSNVAQQTQFTVSSDGTVSSSIISRPDLQANSSQAPTRSPIQRSTSTTATTESTSTDTTETTSTPETNQERQKFCEQNPNSSYCAELGSVDYEDLILPKNTIDLDFRPSDYFSTTGTCPMPRSVDFGMFGTHEFSYEPLCDFAAKIRPILIAITILSCAWFVSGALKEV